MLRRNIDTASWLVNGPIGTVVDIKVNAIEVKFDHINDVVSVKKVKSRFLVMKRLCVQGAVSSHSCIYHHYSQMSGHFTELCID